VKKSATKTTERRNARSRGLDLKSTREILRIINREDSRVPAAVAREIPAIARAVDAIAAALRRGGRLFYVGAGTSGRLVKLEAAECPPTFGTPPETVQAIIAGGREALERAVEGAEDATTAAEHALQLKKVGRADVIVGLTASGETRYVLAALEYARRHGAATIGITCNRGAAIEQVSETTIVVESGPEVVTGSTRMKAGTAQKLVLNMLSTAVMVRLGHVYDNWMINVAQTNRKLRCRAERILEEATGADVSAVRRAMRHAGHDLRVALVMLKRNVGASEAKKRLRNASGNLRAALGEARRKK
jgi:N-acetylmuramic acid 6-phosphate etherase